MPLTFCMKVTRKIAKIGYTKDVTLRFAIVFV